MEDKTIEVPGCPDLKIEIRAEGREYAVVDVNSGNYVANVCFPGYSKDDKSSGATNEALISIVFDRVEKFQAGPHSCDENEEILDHLASTLTLLEYRRIRIFQESSS